MKKLNLIAIVLFNLIITSCNDETTKDDLCDGDNYPITLDRYVTKLSHNSLFSEAITKYDYTYNEFNLLAEIDRKKANQSTKSIFDYQCNNNLSSNKTRVYTYNEQNQLIAFSGSSINYMDYEIFYNGNTINVTGTIDSAVNTELILEINASNLITKIIRATNYSTFEYDVNGNLIKTIDFDLNDELLIAYEISYDENINPFYGQLSSIYIERFIHYFSTSAFDGADNFFRFDGFSFPYLKNNPILLKDVNCVDCYSILERIYTYDAQNYPTKFEEIHVGAPGIMYDIEYQ